ncbi:hypothetical protein EDD18DRAFT_1115667 [Armillaria luteobubalina]|uniref:Uncharacterized protein n=1 Tax=Armillaria luteobubalina TaxID=153913 RepID=A0AA39P2X3_9AGAR|nr:hypothetical protein EDD18DRAFT_1115667 [Armillaria luteobubalina]
MVRRCGDDQARGEVSTLQGAARGGGGVVNNGIEVSFSSLPYLSTQRLVLYAIQRTVVVVVPPSPSHPLHLSTTTVIVLVLAIVSDIDVDTVIAVVMVILVVLVVVPAVALSLSSGYCHRRVEGLGGRETEPTGNHKRTCKQRIEQSAIDSQFNLDQNESQAANVECEAINTPRLLFSNQAQSNSSLDSQFEDLHLDSQRNLPSSLSFQPVSSEDEDGNSSNPIINAADEILDLVNPYNPQFQIEYHPSALLDPCILTREEYFQMTALEMTDSFLDEKTNTKMRIFDEPWTGNVLWEVQSSLPPGGKPLAYILYADKTRLSSFGTAKGYPVIARIANLPDAIWNGKDWGGGTVVGWLPVVEDDPKHKGKPTWINFKTDILEVYIPQTTEEMQELYDRAEDEGEEILDKVSLQNVENVFWSIANSDPYKAVSWDRLHAYHLGVFRHLLNRLLEHIENIPGAEKHHAKVVIDEFINNFPRWKNFTHFTNQLLFAAHSVLSKAANPNAYLLLKVIQSYLELDMYASMDVHTEKSIEEGRQLLQVFEATLKAYTEATDNQNFKNLTSWSIPKVHTQQHLFDDIIAKGATKNYNTKVNESMHGPLKKTYQTQTNFKNVSEQILMTDHRYKIAMQLRQKIDLWQAQMTSVDIEANDSAEAEDDDIQNEEIESLDSKAKLHSLQFTSKDPRTFEELETAFHSDPAYERFRIRLGNFMTGFLNQIEKGTIPAGKFIQYKPNDIEQCTN